MTALVDAPNGRGVGSPGAGAPGSDLESIEDRFGDALAEVEIEDRLQAQLDQDEMEERLRQILANDDLMEQKT